MFVQKQKIFYCFSFVGWVKLIATFFSASHKNENKKKPKACRLFWEISHKPRSHAICSTLVSSTLHFYNIFIFFFFDVLLNHCAYSKSNQHTHSRYSDWQCASDCVHTQNRSWRIVFGGKEKFATVRERNQRKTFQQNGQSRWILWISHVMKMHCICTRCAQKDTCINRNRSI